MPGYYDMDISEDKSSSAESETSAASSSRNDRTLDDLYEACKNAIEAKNYSEAIKRLKELAEESYEDYINLLSDYNYPPYATALHMAVIDNNLEAVKTIAKEDPYESLAGLSTKEFVKIRQTKLTKIDTGNSTFS